MKWGLIARGEDRGLGTMTWAIARKLGPDRVLLVDPQDTRFTVHHDRFPGAEVATFDGHRFDQRQVLGWAHGLDAVYTAETIYDWQLPNLLAAQGCATVVHGMPEFYRHGRPGHEDWQQPTAWWWPTGWLADRIPAGPLVRVPAPHDAPRAIRRPAGDGPLTLTHVIGHRAYADRNGTLQLMDALRRCREAMVVHLWTQEDRLPVATRVPSHVQIVAHTGGTADRWAMYEDAHLAVMPRRYGGLCLPAQEALACGLGLVMPDVVPNREWPIQPIPVLSRPAQQIEVAFGHVDLAIVQPGVFAQVLDELARDPERVRQLQLAADAWTDANSWESHGPTYLDQLRVASQTLDVTS